MGEITIPMIDMPAQLEDIGNKIELAMARVLWSGRHILGPEVEAFERAFAEYTCAEGACGVASGTDALRVALQSFGIGPGDKIIVPTFTFIATAFAVSSVGATPIFCDVDKYGNINVDMAKELLTDATGCIAVHLFGHPVDKVFELARFCKANNKVLIEDCAQAHGAWRLGRHVGIIGDAGCFSFFPSKNLGAVGDAGIVISRHADVVKKCKLIRNQGRTTVYEHVVKGFNSRMDPLQAAVLMIKLQHLDSWHIQRKRAAATYYKLLNGIPLVDPMRPPHHHVFHQFVCRSYLRDGLRQALADNGIASAIHYPKPCHKQEAYREVSDTHLPMAEQLSKEVFSLPICPYITDHTINKICKVIREYCQARLKIFP